jgi:hypothetical protein
LRRRRRHRVRPRGAEHFSQTVTITDLYRYYGIDSNASIAAAQAIAHGRPIRYLGAASLVFLAGNDSSRAARSRGGRATGKLDVHILGREPLCPAAYFDLHGGRLACFAERSSSIHDTIKKISIIGAPPHVRLLKKAGRKTDAAYPPLGGYAEQSFST